MPHFQVRAHMQLVHDLSTEIASHAPDLEATADELVEAVENLADTFEHSPLRYVRFSEVVTGFGGVEVLLEEALNDVRGAHLDQARDKCRIAMRMVDRVQSIISHDPE